MLEIECRLGDRALNVARAPLFDEQCHRIGKYLGGLGLILTVIAMVVLVLRLVELGPVYPAAAVVGWLTAGFLVRWIGDLSSSRRKVSKCNACGFIEPRH